MSLTALLRKRRNVYGFLPKPVSDELLSGILEDAIRVPSAGFTQDFDLVVVRNKSTKKRLAEASREEEYVKSNSALSDFITTAPVLIVPCANKQRYEAKYGRGVEGARLPWWLIDAGFVSLALLLATFEKGLAASFLGAIDDQMIAGILRLPDDGSIVPIATIPLGYADPREKPLWKGRYLKAKGKRRPLDDVVHWDTW